MAEVPLNIVAFRYRPRGVAPDTTETDVYLITVVVREIGARLTGARHPAQAL